MMISAMKACQKALYERLDNDITLMAMIEGVYDVVPENTAYPFVTLAALEGKYWESVAENGVEVTMQLRCYDRSGGHKAAFEIMERIETLLLGSALILDGFSVVMMHPSEMQLNRQNDEQTVKIDVDWEFFLKQTV